MKKVLIAIVILFPVVVVLWLGLSHRPNCNDQLVSEQTSSDGHYIAVWMVRKCGTDAPIDHINMRLLNDTFHRDLWNGTITADEVFTLDTLSGRVKSISWVGARRLVVKYESAEPGPHRENLWRDVTVEYPNH